MWPLAPWRPSPIGGATLQEPAYREFILNLKRKDFEIAFHNATSHSVPREHTLRALDRFREVIGHDPKVHCNHAGNEENIYWGAARLSSHLWRAVYRLATIGKARRFYGHDPQSSLFWGDLCQERVSYVRNFVFREVNLLRVNPTLPYHDPARPYVNWWFSSTEAPDVRSFCMALSPEAQDRLEAEGGVCIIYTHLASGFAKDGVLDAPFVQCIERLAGRPGWFVPVGDLLDFLRGRKARGDIPPREHASMQRRWIMEKIRYGSS